MQSCAKGEWSYEESRADGNGYFTKNFAIALSGEADVNNDGKLTLFEVCSWTSKNTKAEVLKAKKETQRPFLSGSSPNYILMNDPNVPKAKALVDQARQATKAEDYELAIKKYDEAIALCPRLSYIKDERDSAEQLLEAKQRREAAEQHDLSIPGKVAGERKTITVDGVEFAFRWCPPGTFLMGSPTGEAGKKELNSIYEGKDFEKIERQRKIKLTQGFWMLETEVTVGMFKAFFGEAGYVSQGYMPVGYSDNEWKGDSKFSWRNPGFTQGDDHPVTCVSWIDASAFCEWLSKKTGVKIQLPTEAQWEYACRAGSNEEINEDELDDMAWYELTSDGYVSPVGKKLPNAWGLYDMLGNVKEWCLNWYLDISPKETAYAPDADHYPVVDINKGMLPFLRVMRGGDSLNEAADCQPASRFYNETNDNKGAYNVGFRVLKSQ